MHHWWKIKIPRKIKKQPTHLLVVNFSFKKNLESRVTITKDNEVHAELIFNGTP